MFFSLNYISHPLEKVNEVSTTFFLNSITTQQFTTKLFPEWFVPVIKSAPILKKKFKEVFDNLVALDESLKKELFDRLTIDLNIEQICSGNNSQPIYSFKDYPLLHELFKNLYYHLYNETLQKSTVLNNLLETSIQDHFQKWKDKNNTFTVCPFCGLENYTSSSGTNRDPYDHWLCKDKYPLSAINFKNLIPIGDKCNQTAVKGNKDIIHFESDFSPRPFFYPYTKSNGFRIELSCLKVPSVGFKGDWEISIKPNDLSEANKIENWMLVFNLHERYISWLKTFAEAWREEFHKYIFKNGIILSSDLNKIREYLDNWKKSLPSINIYSGVMLLEAYIDYLISKANDPMILAFANIQLNASN